MKKPMFKLLLVSTLLASGSAAADEISKILDADPNAEIKVFNTAGEIEIEGWSKNQVEVEADLGSSVEELIFRSDGDDVLIEVKVPKRGSRSIVSDLVIKVPMGASLNIDGVSADIVVEGVRGRQDLQTVSGDIETVVFDNDLVAETVSGDIVAEGNDEPMRTKANTVSGEIEIRNFDGEIEISAVSGDLAIYDSRFEDVNAQTVNGDIEYNAGLYGESRMHLETVNGEVDVNLDDEVSAKIDVETFNGNIRNCFGPEPQRTSKYAPGRELKFTSGDGGGRVVIRTLNGDVSICND